MMETVFVAVGVIAFSYALYNYLLSSSKVLPTISVAFTPEEARVASSRTGQHSNDHNRKNNTSSTSTETNGTSKLTVREEMPLVVDTEPEVVQCYDPCTGECIGTVENMSTEMVGRKVELAREAQKKWRESTFNQRKEVMQVLLQYYSSKENQKQICQIIVRDSGKTMLDSVLGEIIPTCEKLRWMISQGEGILKPSYRTNFLKGQNGLMTIHKQAVVEYEPLGVLGVIAPFNYPCHNLLNHIISGLFAGTFLCLGCLSSELCSRKRSRDQGQ